MRPCAPWRAPTCSRSRASRGWRDCATPTPTRCVEAGRRTDALTWFHRTEAVDGGGDHRRRGAGGGPREVARRLTRARQQRASAHRGLRPGGARPRRRRLRRGSRGPGRPRDAGRRPEAGMRVAFVTNNAARPPRAVAEHLRELGVEAARRGRRHHRPGGRPGARRALRAGARSAVSARPGLEEALRERGPRAGEESDDDVRGAWRGLRARRALARDHAGGGAGPRRPAVGGEQHRHDDPDRLRASPRATGCWSRRSRDVRRASSRTSPASRRRRCSRRPSTGSAASARWWSGTASTPTSRAPCTLGWTACWCSPASPGSRSWCGAPEDQRPTYVAPDLAGLPQRPRGAGGRTRPCAAWEAGRRTRRRRPARRRGRRRARRLVAGGGRRRLAPSRRARAGVADVDGVRACPERVALARCLAA